MPNFNINVAQPFQGLQGVIGEHLGRQQQAGWEEEAQALYASGDLDALADFSIKHPELGERVREQAGHKSAATEAIRRDVGRKIMFGGDHVEIITEAAEKVRAAGGDPSQMESLLELPPEEALKIAEEIMVFQFPTDYQALQTYKSRNAPIKMAKGDRLIDPITKEVIVGAGGSGTNLGTVSPKDFTVKSMAAYAKSGNIEDLVRYRPKTVKINNIEHIYNGETGKFEPVVDYGSQELTEQEAASAENEAMRASRLEFGKQKDVWDNNQPKYLNNISAAEQKQTVVRNTADRIKELVSGWSTKYGSSLSSIPGSEARTLKGLIDTMKANSAFSTLTDLKASGGTLGAISEAELNLLERAWGALDQGGDNAEFLRVVDQLVTQNSGGIDRLRNAFSMNKKRFSGSYDDAQRQRQEENTVNWDDL